ncbi:MAG: molybdopterin-dependent oxidoreductase, partial [Bacteroidales bacterium]
MNHRLLKPLLKQKDQWIEITFPEAFEHIANALKSYSNSETVFFGGGSYSNEELYLIQKIAREGVKTNAICSFEYLTRGSEFQFDKNDIVPFAEMAGASRFFCFGFDLQSPYPTLNVVKQIMEVYPQIPRTFFNQDSKIFIKNFQAFFRAVNYYLVQHQLIKGIYIEGLGKNYQAYASALLSDLYNDLLAENNLQSFDIEYFVNMILVEKNPV